MSKSSFPHVSKALLDELKERFPDRMPDLHRSLDDIRYEQGQVAVVRFLQQQFDIQNENILEGR
jgi:hypothetical protein